MTAHALSETEDRSLGAAKDGKFEEILFDGYYVIVGRGGPCYADKTASVTTNLAQMTVKRLPTSRKPKSFLIYCEKSAGIFVKQRHTPVNRNCKVR